MRSLTRSALVVAVLTLSTAAIAGEPVGTFNVEGRNPGGVNAPPAYTGTVTITKSGDIYTVLWVTGAAKEKTEGRGMLENGVFSVAYPVARPAGAGLVVYTQKGNTWVGRWILPGVTAPGTEVLTPAK